jgi:hypothetical protein
LDPDPYWIRIRIGIQPKMLDLDPDPDEMNADPQPSFFWWRIFSYGGIFFRRFLSAILTFDWSNLYFASSDWLVSAPRFEMGARVHCCAVCLVPRGGVEPAPPQDDRCPSPLCSR